MESWILGDLENREIGESGNRRHGHLDTFHQSQGEHPSVETLPLTDTDAE